MGDTIDWSSLECEKILNIDWHTKYIALLVNVKSSSCPDGASSILLANRQGFDSSEQLFALFNSTQITREIQLLDHNDIYYRFLISAGDTIDCKLTLIHPATPAHISKYTRQERFLVAESPYLYESVVRPWIDSHAAARIKWIDNILNGISEQDKLLYRNTDPDTGFVLLPDSKWDQRSLSSLYLLAITMRRDIHSLRDLSEKHLPVLKEMQKVMASKIHEQYNLDPKKLRFYVHYLPTYYYFHIHVVHVDLETPGCAIGAAHLLDDIIDNIENISGDYYQRKTMHYYIGSEHELYRSVIKDKQ